MPAIVFLAWVRQLVASGVNDVTAYKAIKDVVTQSRAPSAAEWALADGTPEQHASAPQPSAQVAAGVPVVPMAPVAPSMPDVQGG